MSLSNEEIALLKSLLDKVSPPPTEGVVASPQVATPSPSPKIDLDKLKHGLLNITDPVLWLKEICGWINLRKIIIILLIAGSVYGWGYIKGVQGKPVHVELGGKEAVVELSENLFLHILPDGTLHTQDAKGNTISKIKVKDIPALEKALKPIGFDVKPFFVAGGSLGIEKLKYPELGIGTSIYKFYRVHLDAWLTQIGVYVGADYALTPNSGIIGGVGKGYKEGDTRVFLGYKWNF